MREHPLMCFHPVWKKKYHKKKTFDLIKMILELRSRSNLFTTARAAQSAAQADNK